MWPIVIVLKKKKNSTRKIINVGFFFLLNINQTHSLCLHVPAMGEWQVSQLSIVVSLGQKAAGQDFRLCVRVCVRAWGITHVVGYWISLDSHTHNRNNNF